MTTRPNDDDRDMAVELLGKIYIRLDVGAEVFTVEGDPDNIAAVLDLIRQIEARTYERAIAATHTDAAYLIDAGILRSRLYALRDEALASRGGKS